MDIADDQWNRLGTGNLVIRLIQWVISLLVTLVLIGAVYYFKHSVGYFLLNEVGLPEDGITLGVKVVLALWVFSEVISLIWTVLAHRRLRYRIGDDAVVASGGVYTTFTHTIPRSRVQSVQVKAGPVQRLFGLATVTITTAGVHSPDLEIENLQMANAQAIQARMGVDHGV